MASDASIKYVSVYLRGAALGLTTSMSSGIARRTAQDDIYEGYMIPKGTVVIPNVWYVVFSP